MKYEVGDRVVLILRSGLAGQISKEFDKLPDGVATIESIDYDEEYYYMKEIPWEWVESEIKCLENDYYKLFISIESRFKLMDFE